MPYGLDLPDAEWIVAAVGGGRLRFGSLKFTDEVGYRIRQEMSKQLVYIATRQYIFQSPHYAMRAVTSARKFSWAGDDHTMGD
jgi:hypothetical protein